MNHRATLSLVVILALMATCSGVTIQQLVYAQSTPETSRGEAKPDTVSLREYAIPIRTIDPEDDDYSDLMPLVEKIGGARIVVLGEATHSEGTTSKAKARVARFLHQRMGFDVLAWETGLVQAHGMNVALRDPNVSLDEAKGYLMSGGWAYEKATHPLLSYARSTWQTHRPLIMAGFDTGRPHKAVPYFRQVLTDFFELAPSLAFTEAEWELVDQLVQRGWGFYSRERPPDDERLRQRAVLENLRDQIRSERLRLRPSTSEQELALVERFVHQALLSEGLKYILQTSGPTSTWNLGRDRAMADAFLWLANTLYPDHKIIIWAATAHLIRNADLIDNAKQENAYPVPYHMGHHLYASMGDDLYTIAFTAYDGEYGDIFPEGSRFETRISQMTPAPQESFEATAHALNEPYLFVDLRHAPAESWLRSSFLSLCLGRLENLAPWSQVLDAFFFIGRAEPIENLPRPE